MNESSLSAPSTPATSPPVPFLPSSDACPAPGTLWTDISGTDEERASKLQQELTNLGLALPDALLEEALTPLRFPESHVSGGTALMRMPSRLQWDTENSAYITFLLLPQKLVTLHGGPAPELDQIHRGLHEEPDPDIRDSASMFLFLLDALVENNIRTYTAARAVTEQMADAMDEEPETVAIEDLLQLRRQVGRIAAQFEDQFHSLAGLLVMLTHAPYGPDLREELHNMQDVQNHLLRSITRLETRLRDLQQYGQSLVQQRTEKRLRQLTVLTTLFMPLTLITGIYGMNFNHMPELSWEYGYVTVLGGMIVLAITLLVFYARKGWFR